MTNKVLEKKVESLEKDVTYLKSLIVELVRARDDEGKYKAAFVRKILKNAKDKTGSVRYTDRKDFLNMIRS